MEAIPQAIPTVAQDGVEAASKPDDRSTAGAGYSGDLETGLSRALGRFMDSAPVDSSTSITLSPVKEPDSPMSMLRERVGEFINLENNLDLKVSSMGADKTVTEVNDKGVLQNFETSAREMLALQMQYQYKTLNGSLLLSTAKSSEGFVKTLMRSQ